MVFVGYKNDVKDIMYVGVRECQHCGNNSHFYITETSFQPRLYFISIAKLNKKYFLKCATCERGVELDKTKVEKLLKEAKK